MKRNGITQDITVLPVNSQPIMVVQIGTGEDIELLRWGIDTVIEYFTEATGLWNVGTILSPNTVKDEKTQEVVKLPANTPVRLKETPTESGILILSTKKYDIEYNAEDLQIAYQFLYGSGIVSDKLYGNIIASGGRQITIQSSMFVIDGFVGFFKNPQSVIVDIGDSSPRKDLLLLRKVQAEGDVYLAIKRGIPSANPEPPKLTQNTDGIYEMALAEITMQANSQSISQGDVKDVRMTGFFSIINMVYPVGSTYISFNADFNPNNAWQGTKWKLLKEGLFLEATQQIQQIGKEIEAGLPPLRGKIDGSNNAPYVETFGEIPSTGVVVTPPFYIITGLQGATTGDGKNGPRVRGIGFDASLSHRIYRDNCDTVQPHSVKAFIWIRIA